MRLKEYKILEKNTKLLIVILSVFVCLTECCDVTHISWAGIYLFIYVFIYLFIIIINFFF